MTIRFEPRDIWVGPFWDRRPDGLHIYVCPTEIPSRFLTVPVLPAPSPIMAEIKRALAAGEDVPGARLVAAKRALVIR